MLCLGITPDDHAWLQAHRDDVEVVAAYLHEHEIACALAHPFFAVAAPLTARHRRRLAELFGIWEVRNGARDAELNRPAAIYIETHGGTGIGGTDDHAGIDIGRTCSETAVRGDAGGVPRPRARRPRAGARRPGQRGALGAQRDGARRARARPRRRGAPPDPARRAAHGRAGDAPTPTRAAARAAAPTSGPTTPARCCAPGSRRSSSTCPTGDLIAHLQADGFSHADLYRARAGAATSASSRAAVGRAAVGRGRAGEAALADAGARRAVRRPACRRSPTRRPPPSSAARSAGSPRAAPSPCASPCVADGVGSDARRHAHARRDPRARRARLRGRGHRHRPARRPPAARRRRGRDPVLPRPARRRPRLPAIVDALAEGRYELLHVCAPGPAGVAARADRPAARAAGRRLLPHGAGRLRAAALGRPARRARRCSSRSAPSTAAAASSSRRPPRPTPRWPSSGIAPERIGALGPRRRHRALLARAARARPLPGRPRDRALRRAGSTREKGVDLLADAFLAARARDPRLHLVLAGGGPEEARLRARLGRAATFLGWLDGDDARRRLRVGGPVPLLLADRHLRPGRARGAGVRACPSSRSAAGGPAELIADGRSGLLCPPRPRRSPAPSRGSRARGRCASGSRAAASPRSRERTWEAALGRLAAGWRRARAGGDARAAAIDRTPRTCRARAAARSRSRSTTSSPRRSSAAR